jgi:hypothetical protein
MFRLAVSLIGFITTAAMHPAIADPASVAPPATAHYAPASKQPAQAQVRSRKQTHPLVPDGVRT